MPDSAPSPAVFDLLPTLQGETLRLRPLAAADLEPLWQVARDPLLWELHPDKTRCQRDGFERFFAAALHDGALAVVERATGGIVGSSRFYDWDAGKREVAIGYTFLARQCWGGGANAEMKQLMLDHASRRADRVWFHVAKMNLRSRRAMEKLGASAAFEAPRPQNGAMIDFIYYCVDIAQWRSLRSS